MKVRDKTNKQTVDVADKRCLACSCYWPRPDPGVFTQGQGYRTRSGGNKRDWMCGEREAHGCPYNKVCRECGTKHPEYEIRCRECRHSLENTKD